MTALQVLQVLFFYLIHNRCSAEAERMMVKIIG